MDWLNGDLLDHLSAPALLLLGFLFFMLGLIKPRSDFRELQKAHEARIAELRADRDDWREAHRLSESAREVLATTTREQVELTRTAVDALKGFRTAASWLEQERGEPS